MEIKTAIFDTCILIDYLNGIPPAADTLKEYAGNPAISIITWMEVMVGAARLGDDQRRQTRHFLAQFMCIPISEDIAEMAVAIRASAGVKLPDAIIDATARVTDRLLITRNVRDFKQNSRVLCPYQSTPNNP
jgi:predicted nucleic acid-binding protein